ncbi:MAG: DUF4105 domain-containing protein [Spirochaetia bacterium]|nr:DUF4105 domain-containing protein [Spirochaetia bacterium]
MSIITVRYGDKIYTAFGHTGIRIQDKKHHMDKLYNYGTFDFDTPGFVSKFVKGQLNYCLAIENFRWELRRYGKKQDRTVIEQVLNLSTPEIMKIYRYLEENALPENKYYKYDFIKNNCSSKIRTALNEPLQGKIIFDHAAIESISEHSYRDYIRSYLGENPWFDLGIQLTLGNVIDRKVSEADCFFLPDMVKDVLAESKLKTGKPLIKETNILYQSEREPKAEPKVWNIPFIFFMTLILLELLFFIQPVKTKKIACIFECGAIVINILAGLLLFYLWHISDHTATVCNINLLWCTPLNIIFLITYLKKNKNILKVFSGIEASLCTAYLCCILGGIQKGCGSLYLASALYLLIFIRNIFQPISRDGQ